MTNNLDGLIEKTLPNLIYNSSQGFIIGIDGRAGSGKTTLSNKILNRFQAVKSIALDEFHFPKDSESDQKYDYKRLIKEVIKPFKEGIFPIKYQRYNFGDAKGLDFDGLDEWITIEKCNILIIEGFSISVLNGYCDLSIWVESDPLVSIDRAVKRNTEEYGLLPMSKAQKEKWANSQENWITQNKPMEIVDLVVGN